MVRGSEYKDEGGNGVMTGSNSLEVVRNMKRISFFTGMQSLALIICIAIFPGLLETLGLIVYSIFMFLSLYLFFYSVKQHALWTANEVRLLNIIVLSECEK